MTNLVWFRSDLRIHDNTALARATASPSTPCIGVFLLAPAQWQRHDWSSIKVDLLLRTLAELSAALADRNIPLLIRSAPRFADAPRALLDLARLHKASALFYNREYELNEARRDAAVDEAFMSAGITTEPFHDQTVIAPGELFTKEGRVYTVFTPFKKAWITRLQEHGGFPVHAAPRKRPELPAQPDPVPASLPEFKGHTRPDLWEAGETHAAKRLRAFISKRITNYNTDRDIPAINGTSTLSPYLSIGAISPRQCLAAALDANDGRYDAGAGAHAQGPPTWISELVWREFYRHLIHATPRLSMHRAFKPETERLRWRESESDLAAWQAGRTGVPIVDAAMRQLAQTGWMHNRLRMISAMYFTKDLFLDWRLGERHFMRSLVDGDLAQNNGGWQWSASTGTDAAPYFRIFNPVSQSRTFDPSGDFIRRFVPELALLSADDIHEPWVLPPIARSRLDYPQTPIADHSAARARVLSAFKSLTS